MTDDLSPDEDRLRFLFSTAEAVARLMHPHAEVVVHDMRRNRVAAIYNSLSGRRVGDPSGIEDFEGLAAGEEVSGPFRKETAHGRELKYVSSVLRDATGQVLGLLCINLEVTALRRLVDSGRRFLEVESSESFDAHFDDDWQGRIDAFVRQYLEDKLLSLERLSRGQRRELVASLKGAGAFQAKSSANYVANVLGVSRSTVYNDLAGLGNSSVDE